MEKTKRLAQKLAIQIQETYVSVNASTEECVNAVEELAHYCDGVVVQLPLPESIAVERVLNSVPKEKDADMLSQKMYELFKRGKTDLLPAVVSAIRFIGERYALSYAQKKVLVVGEGRLVGKPVAHWLSLQGARVWVVTKKDSQESFERFARDADIVVLGAGVPGILTPSMVKEGVVIFDAGTSEEAGVLKGDASPECSQKASLFTPVPGGIGPLTVTALFNNLLKLIVR